MWDGIALDPVASALVNRYQFILISTYLLLYYKQFVFTDRKERYNLIQINGLHKAYRDNEVLKNITLDIPTGSIFGLIGRSGTGKSTLLRCINGLENFQKGSLLVDGTPVQELSGSDLRRFRKDIGMIFQNFSLLERLTVYENVALPMVCWKYPSKEINEKVTELLELVGIPEKIHSRPCELSGGQKQRVAIARALTMNPKILLCDEATSALDPRSAQSIVALLDRINHELGITMVMVTHQMSVVRSCCDQVAILENGTVDAVGTPEDIFLDQPSSLMNLIGETSIPVNTNDVNIKVLFADDAVHNPLLTSMARDLQIDFSINGSDTHAYRKGIRSIVQIGISPEHTEMVKDYLTKHQVKYQIISLEGGKM